jgi:hypothetical protein
MKSYEKWEKAKRKLERAKALEFETRKKLGDAQIQGEETRITFLHGDNKVAIARKVGYTVPKASIEKLRKKLGQETFDKLFYVSHSLREGAYKGLTPKQKKIADKFISEYEAPYQITITER